MKVLPFTIPKPDRDALILQEDHQPAFYEFLHQHKELQISYIKQGHGTLVIGNSIGSYSKDDVIILGGDLPHVFRSDSTNGQTSHMLSVFFTESSFGTQFFQTEELKSLKSFFRKAENGFKISPTSEKIRSLFQQLNRVSKFDRFILFFQLLKLLNKAKSQPLSSFVSDLTSDKAGKRYTDIEGQRMGAVLRHTMDHFREKISLNEIAKQAAMTPNAFCKYFKKRTRKTYISFLNEIRIEEACRLLQGEDDITIAQIAEQSGFQNISNFNRHFKALKGISPSNFRKQMAS